MGVVGLLAGCPGSELVGVPIPLPLAVMMPALRYPIPRFLKNFVGFRLHKATNSIQPDNLDLSKLSEPFYLEHGLGAWTRPPVAQWVLPADGASLADFRAYFESQPEPWLESHSLKEQGLPLDEEESSSDDDSTGEPFALDLGTISKQKQTKKIGMG